MIERVIHIDGEERGERRKVFSFCKVGEEMAVHIQSCRQRVQSAGHQSVLGDARCESALENTWTSGPLIEDLASKGPVTHLVGTQVRGVGLDIEIMEVTRRWMMTRATAGLMMRKEISPAPLLLQFLPFSGVAHTEVARKQDEKVMTWHRLLDRTSPISLLGYTYITWVRGASRSSG